MSTEITGTSSANAVDDAVIVDESMLSDKVYEVRGQKVMLDFDLAEIYGYSTKRFNEQVKNNIEKFDEDFRFQLTTEETRRVSRSKKSTLKNPGRGSNIKYNPYAFTEQGIYMLMTVLRGDLAIRQSKALIRLFKRMKDLVSERQLLLDERDRLRLSAQVADNMLDIAVIRRDLSKVEAEVADVVDELGETVRRSELNEIMRDFGAACARNGFLVLDGNPVQAAAFHAAVFSCARESVFVVDDYPGARTLALLGQVHPSVRVTLFTDNKGRGISTSDIKSFELENPGVALDLRPTGCIVHDRYIFIDYGTDHEALYHCGASIKDAGVRATTVNRIADAAEYHTLFERLLGQSPLNVE